MRTLKAAMAAASLGTVLVATQAGAADVVLQWQTANLTEAQFEPVWKQMIAEFEASHPGVKIEPVLVARKDHWTKFVTAAQARQAPCVVSVDVATAAYNGYLMPLDEYWQAEPDSFQNAWSEDVLKAARFEGELYGVPSWGGVYAEVYNRELVEKAGLDPSNPPKTWDEYLAWAKKLTHEDQWATAVLGGPTDTTTRVLLAWIYSNGGEPFDADMTDARFAEDPKSLEAIKFYLGLATDASVAAPGATTTNYLEQTNLFAQGKIATMRNAYWSIAKVVGDNPEMAGKMFVAFPPMHADQKATLATMTADSISSNCEHPDEAWEFIKFNNEPKWAIQRAKVANWLPLRSDLLNEPEIKEDAMLAQFLEIGQYARTYPLPHPAWAEIAAKDVVEAVQAALLEPARTEEIFKALDEKLDTKLNDY
jgi:multiple sugar transport system substrate-binding protein